MGVRIRILAKVSESSVEAKQILTGVTRNKKTYEASYPDTAWYKQNIPCMEACPAHTRVPEYLDAISRGDFNKSYLINRQDNIFPHTLGRVCAHPCESACRHGFEGLGAPVSICWSKRTGSDFMDTIPPLKPQKKRDKKVAVVGAGPCGLTIANDLALLGYSVTVYEELPKAGGMLIAGIPEFRLPRDLVQREINEIIDLGVELKLNTKIGKDESVTELKKNYDAVAFTSGCMKPVPLNIPGENLIGVVSGLDFMMEVNSGQLKEMRGTVVVIGGGFTAMDCSRTALRLGAKKVIVLYRRTKKELLVDDRELREASFEGVEFRFLVAPLEVLSGNGKNVSSLKCITNKLGEPGADGRRSPVPIEGSEFSIEIDHFIFAVSQSPDNSFIPETLNVQQKNTKIVVEKDSFMTSEEGIFAAGDAITGPQNIINAIGLGHSAAESIHQYCSQEPKKEDSIITKKYENRGIRSVYQWKVAHQEIYDVLPANEIRALPLDQRGSLLEESDLGYNKTDGKLQTDRCYLCNHNIHIDEKECILCANCVDVCPYNCIKIALDDNVAVLNGNGNAKGTPGKSFYMLMDEEKCIRCGLCLDVCPTDCLTMDKIMFEKG